MLADDLADLPRINVLPAVGTLLDFIAFAVLVLAFIVFFMVWNSVVLNTALIATFAPPQAPRMARRVSEQGPERGFPLPCTVMLPLRPKSSGKITLVKIVCRYRFGIIPPGIL